MLVNTKGYSVLQNDEDAFRLDADVSCRIQDGSIHVKVVTGYGDPVELTSLEVRLVAAALLQLAATLDAEDGVDPE